MALWSSLRPDFPPRAPDPDPWSCSCFGSCHFRFTSRVPRPGVLEPETQSPHRVSVLERHRARVAPLCFTPQPQNPIRLLHQHTNSNEELCIACCRLRPHSCHFRHCQPLPQPTWHCQQNQPQTTTPPDPNPLRPALTRPPQRSLYFTTFQCPLHRASGSPSHTSPAPYDTKHFRSTAYHFTIHS